MDGLHKRFDSDEIEGTGRESLEEKDTVEQEQ